MGNGLKHYLLLWGGLIGFTLTFATGLVAGNDIVTILFNASLGCVGGGLLFKWLASMMVEYSLVQKRKAEALAIATAEAGSAPKGKTNPATAIPKKGTK